MGYHRWRDLGRTPFLAALFGSLTSGILAGPVAAQPVVRVPADQPTLQVAINSVPDGGVIEMANGTYAAPAGGFVINDRGKAFTIRPASGATVVLDGGNVTDIVRFINSSVGAGKAVTFENLTFRNGSSAIAGIAGAVTLQMAKATFRNCRFENNAVTSTSTGGGGVEVAVTSEAFFVDCVFTGNSAYFYGGALAVEDSRAWIHRGQFVGNRTNLPNHHPFAGGGAIHVANSTLRASNSRFDSNEAGYVAGAIYALGTWTDPMSTPRTDVVLSDCTFVNNRAARDPSVPSAGQPPTEGGAVHFEDQTTVRIFNSRFLTNSADTGGALNLYRAIVTVKGCLFQGNRAVGNGAGNGFGGAISAISNDVPDATTGGGSINRRTASLTVSDSVIQGRFDSVTTVAQTGGGIYVSGDGNSLYGLILNGMPQNGTAAQNRATVQLTNVAIYDCEVVGSAGNDAGTGVGGGIESGLASVTATDLLLGRTIAGQSSGVGAGGGLSALGQSLITFTNPFVSAAVAGTYGAGLFVQGSQIAISGGSIVENQLINVGGTANSFGAGMFSGPDIGVGVAVTGTVASTLFSRNNGLPIFDDDRISGPINGVQYNGNSIYSTTFGTQVYTDSIGGFCCQTVSLLNGLTITRTFPAPNTQKSTSANTSLGAAPTVGVLKALPPLVLSEGASGDPAGPTTSYLVYGWSPGPAQLNGSNVSGFAGMSAASGPGSNSLAVGSSTFPATVLAGASPTASLSAAPTGVSPGGSSTLTWSAPAGTFVDSAFDQGIGYLSAASGTSNVTPVDTTKYTFFQISEEGGATATTTVSVQASPPVIGSFTATPLLIRSGQGSLLSWGTTGATSVTLNGSAVVVNESQSVFPGATTTYTLVATNGLASSSAAVTVNVDAGTAVLGGPVITAPGAGQVLGVAGVPFSWNAVAGATGYGLRLWDAGSGLTVFTGSLAGNGSTSTLLTLPNGTYLLGVRACGGNAFTDGACGGFATRSFSVSLIAPTGSPTVTFPTNGSTLTSSIQTLTWTGVAKADPSLMLNYEVFLTDIGGGNKPELQITVPDPNLSTIYWLHSSSQYELKVRACQAGCGPWSAPVTFAVSLPAVPTGTPSISGCTVTGGNSLTCNWTSVPRAEAYQVLVVQPPPAGPGGGALAVAARQVSETTVTLPVPAGNATVFLTACNGDGCGPYATQDITAAGPNPTQPNIGTPMAGTVVAGPGVLFTWNRVPGDTGSNTWYRLFVQDLSRQATAFDVYTTQNYYSAYFKAEGARYDVLVVSNPGLAGQVVGPAQGFSVSGASTTAPTMVAPAHNSTVSAGNIQLGWSPVPGATLYEYYVAVLGQGTAAHGVTPGLVVQVPLAGAVGGTLYSGIVRACPAGATCVFGSDAGWGPWSNAPGGPGVTNFTVTP
jgi:hypothetical protein